MGFLQKLRDLLHWERSSRPEVDLSGELYEQLKPFRLPFVLVQLGLFLGTLGYLLVTDYTLLQAFFQSSYTFTTTGFGALGEDKFEGPAVFYTACLMIAGSAVLSFATISIIDVLNRGKLVSIIKERRMLYRIARLKKHFVICYHNEYTIQLSRQFREAQIPFVVVDPAPDFEEEALKHRYPYFVNADPHTEIAMLKSHLSSARGMITVSKNAADNIAQIASVRLFEKELKRKPYYLPEVNEWQNRPLDKIYPVIFFDGIVFNSRKDNKIVSKCVYSVLGINMEGQKEILGTWISENESASFYASICSDLKNRGVTDIFIACHDNLTGLNEAIKSIFPKTKNQLCIVHQIRNSCKFVPYKDRKAVCADLKKIYGAVNLDDAEFAKEEFREKWDKKYPNILKSWDKNWAELTTFFEFPQEIRRIIYTTNTVESYHRMVRKFTKSKAIFPTDDSIRKVVYMSVQEISKKWTMPVRDWGLAYSQLAIFFEDRLAA